MLCRKLTHCVEVYLRTCVGHIYQEFFCERAVLNILQNLLHRFLRFFGDNLRPRDIIAVFRRVRYRVAHTLETALVDKVYDELHFVDTFKVCVSGVVACFYKRFKTSLHQGANTAAKDCLFAEQVRFSFRAEVRFQNARSRAADTCCVCKTDFQSVARCVLFYCNQARYALTNLIFASYRVARALGRNHDNVDVLRGLDATKVDIEAVCKRKRLAFGEVGFDAFLVKLRLLFVVDKNHDKVCFCSSFRSRHNRNALLFSLCPALAALVKTYDYVHARILEVERVCVTLRAVADDRYCLTVQFVQIAICLIKNSVCHDNFPVLFLIFYDKILFFTCLKE